MERRMTKRTSVAIVSLLAAGVAAAHEGHGIAGPHWHASDLFGLGLAFAIWAGLFWWKGRR
jgi:Na+/proline symporter